jgi:hypothetical protein
VKGLTVEVYREFYRGRTSDCTNGGLSSRFDTFVLTGTNPINKRVVSGPCEPDAECPELVLVEGPYNTVRAVPRELLNSGVWVMFGGNFCYTSDSRFPSDAPIKIFDRVETAEQSRELSQ